MFFEWTVVFSGSWVVLFERRRRSISRGGGAMVLLFALLDGLGEGI